MSSPLTFEQFLRETGVSRETGERLAAYLAVLKKWQSRINLVGKSTLTDPWRRHMLDSAQLLSLIPEGTRVLMDLGSGAGFPGLVLAILGVPEVHLVESDTRKCAFLTEAARVSETKITLHPKRLEALDPFPVDLVTARGFASLARILTWAAPFLLAGAQGLFLKGQSVDDELTEAHKIWMMREERFQSRADPSGQILRIGDLTRV
ncbi:MAG: 16S rRNA (guanine(527)-N(7))-methyltransferase RsmG [Rhodospirillum sp.]|nr:16S rRNA (guanine(527)-N(7))-methyltransferase RsmG [Rhodospirillum sp.]MCF8491629.1 16S rRNA (guanine(527)-N(7))-methyltransferase RsmG [Rhodospirillum sp.]MCF8500130.1 16S rRNA (guanine(527)-N(7))-methyltransferase RsmG [Rhodospirillum sp.]